MCISTKHIYNIPKVLSANSVCPFLVNSQLLHTPDY